MRKRSFPAFLAAPPPIGYVHLYQAVEAVGRALRGPEWQSVRCQHELKYRVERGLASIDSVLKTIADASESGRLAAAYENRYRGADALDLEKWRTPIWRDYFASGEVSLDLPLIDEAGRPDYSRGLVRCTRNIFMRKDSLVRYIAGIQPPPLPEKPALRPASDPMIRAAMRETYTEMEVDPPNINTLPKFVRPRLNAQGADAADRHIKRIGNEQEFASRRRPVGKRR